MKIILNKVAVLAWFIVAKSSVIFFSLPSKTTAWNVPDCYFPLKNFAAPIRYHCFTSCDAFLFTLQTMSSFFVF